MKITKNAFLLIVVFSLLAWLSGSALAHWDENEPAKWVQLPDLSPTGMDVNVSGHDEIWQVEIEPGVFIEEEVYIPKILADDFECIQTGPITDVHIWGSWKDDLLPKDPTGADNPGNIIFFLGISEDIPAWVDGQGIEHHSRPGELKWGRFFFPGEFDYQSMPVPCGESWYDPNNPEEYNPEPSDFNVWQYNFLIDELDAFEQTGTPNDHKIYWLSVLAIPDPEGFTADEEPMFGWKTSLDHWNDDAVWSDLIPDDAGTYPGPDLGDPTMYLLNPWNELRYPSGHPFGPDPGTPDIPGESIDLAFVITPEPATMITLVLGLIPALLKRRHR